MIMPRSRAWLRASQRNWQPETDTRRKTSLPSLSPSAISIIHTDFKFLEENFRSYLSIYRSYL